MIYEMIIYWQCLLTESQWNEQDADANVQSFNFEIQQINTFKRQHDTKTHKYMPQFYTWKKKYNQIEKNFFVNIYTVFKAPHSNATRFCKCNNWAFSHINNFRLSIYFGFLILLSQNDIILVCLQCALRFHAFSNN